MMPVFLPFLAASLLNSEKAVETPPVPAGYKLVWSDEFNTKGKPDPKNWDFEQGFVRNEEAQWYQPDNAICKNNKLVIEARREQKPNPNYRAGSDKWQENRPNIEYTSTSMTTRGLQTWQYGRFEIRAKIDTRPGLWPAWWTLGVDGEWPRNGEIDIMEYYRNMLLANVAWGTSERWKARWASTSTPLEKFENKDWSKKFHIWRMDWDEQGIKLYVDDALLNSVELTRTINEDGTNKNPFQQPHYMVLNLAIAGQNGGDPTNTKFPARFEVDYVRVYQKTP